MRGRPIRDSLSYANVMSTLAVFLALGLGGAWALSRNDVRSKHIKNGAVRSIDVANRNIRGNDLRRNTIDGDEVFERTLNAADILQQKEGVRTSPCLADLDDEVCARADLLLQNRSRVLVFGAGLIRSPDSSFGLVDASCRLVANGTAITAVRPAIDGGDTTTTHGFSLSGVTREPVPRGFRQFSLSCSDPDQEAEIRDATLTVLAYSERR